MSVATELRRPPSLEPQSSDGRLAAALAAAVCVPIVVATVRALDRGWLAIGDNGNFLIRSRDVLTSHHPLLGTWSSASTSIGHDVNHPGPLLFDLLALPAKIGGSGGLAVGVMLLHVACVALLAVFAVRAGGLRLAAASLAGAAALSWTMGSELLYDPWNPHVLLLPFLLLLVLVVAMALGDLAALPVAIAVGSLIIETHLSYTLLVPPLCAWGLGCLVRHHGVRGVVRPAVVAALVGVLCWAQPIADQVHGTGNLGALVGSLGTRQDTVGVGLGVRLASEVLASPPWWARGSFGSAINVPRGQSPLIGGRPNVDGLPSTLVALGGLAALAVVLTLALQLARRRRDGPATAAVGVAVVGLAIAVAVTVRLPVGGVGVPPHQVRYLWPLAVFTTAVAVLALAPARWATRVLGGIAVVLALLTLPTHAVPAGPQADSDAIPVVRDLARRIDPLEDEGTVLYDTRGLRFAEPWTSAVMAALQEKHIDFTVDDDVWVRQLGTKRRDHGDAEARIFVREGDAARDVPPGARRIAFVDGLDMDEQGELATLERSLVDVPIALNRAGEAAVRSGALPAFDGGAPTAEALLSYGGLASLLRDRLIAVPSNRVRELARYADLRYRADRHTVAVFLDPKPYD